MVVINIEGQLLDLPADLSVQFVKNNSIFNFDEAVRIRTTNITVPATDKNNNIFQYANDIHRFNMLAVQRKIDAQMVVNGFALNGYIILTECTAKSYSICFYYNDTIAKEIMDKTLAELYENESASFDPSDDQLNPFAGYGMPVHSGGTGSTPVITAQNILQHINFDIDLGMSNEELKSLVFSSVGYPDVEAMMNYYYKEHFDGGIDDDTYKAQREFFMFYDNVKEPFRYPYCCQILLSGDYTPQYQTGKKILGFFALYDTEITLPDDFYNDCFVISVPYEEPYSMKDGIYDGSYFPANANDFFGRNDGKYFIGDYYFNTNDDSTYGNNVTGSPLGGKTIKIPANSVFSFIGKSRYSMEYLPIVPDGEYSEFNLTAMTKIMQENFRSEWVGDRRVWVRNIPNKIKVGEWLKAVAYINGTNVTYDENADRIVLRSLDIDETTKEIKDVIDIRSIKRVITTFGKTNTIKYPVSQINLPEEIVYPVRTYKDDEKVLMELPYNNGNIAYFYEYEKKIALLSIEDTTENKRVEEYEETGKTQTFYDWENQVDKPFIGRLVQTDDDIVRIEYIGAIKSNVLLSAVFSNNTEVRLRARMKLSDFVELRDYDIINCAGCKFVFVSANWSNDIADLTLYKV